MKRAMRGADGAGPFAERRGDDWVINGHKLWTSFAQFAEWMILLCRSDRGSKYGGLTYFVVPIAAGLGRGVAIDGDTALIGAPFDDDGQPNAGSVYVFVRTGDMWSQQDKLHMLAPASSDWFGFSVALSGNTAVIGAAGDDQKGSAQVFVRTGSSWAYQATLTPPGVELNSLAGYSVAVDGNTAVVGSVYAQTAGELTGRATVFVRSGVTWSFQQDLTSTDTLPNDDFGTSVDVEGDVAIVGAAVLTALFQGSTTFTEKLTLAKYPAYADYQRRTSRLVPLPPKDRL